MTHNSLAATLLLICLITLPAQGHAILLQSTPSANQVVNWKSIPIKLRFNSRVDGKRSRLSLLYPDGQERPLTIEQPTPDSVFSRAADLAPGSYTLRWLILAEDGHVTRGEVPFQVK
ncbi:MAG TPA: copper resistance CopC family protein [Vicinamibacterales bacterium]